MMKVSGTGLNSAIKKQHYPKVRFASVPKKPGGQTSLVTFGDKEGHSISITSTKVEFKASILEGFTLDGYFLGTFEFDSLTGHPGIRY